MDELTNLVRNIWAIGRNYQEHARELGNDIPTEPVVFLKAGSTLVINQNSFAIPNWMTTLHHEVEVVLRFDDMLKPSHVALALDLTDRNKQLELKSRGLPWTLSKSFKGACPTTKFVPLNSLTEIIDLEFTLSLNGVQRQSGRCHDMIFPLDSILSFVTRHFPVCPGDLLLTGTPSGVGEFHRGDVIEVKFGNLLRHQWTVT